MTEQAEGFPDLQAVRPLPWTADLEIISYRKRMGPAYALEALLEGFAVLIADFYSSGLEILHEIGRYVQLHHPDQSFAGRRAARDSYQELSNRVLLKINQSKLQVRKAPEIGWFRILYPDMEQFMLPFPQVQGLNSSWQWYEKGIFIPVLRKHIHPWYGTYFPTRFEHLELFENWLKQYRGSKDSAIDVGIGSGVLTMQMLNHGIGPICGTDINPNAIIGMNAYVTENKLESKVKLFHGNLFEHCPAGADLIVFNPPWLPAEKDPEGLDASIYYPEGFFASFFEDASSYLHPDGRLVVLFSNLAEITGLTAVHPVETELATGSRFVKVQCITKQVRKASKKTKRELSVRSDEKVELWELRLRKSADSQYVDLR